MSEKEFVGMWTFHPSSMKHVERFCAVAGMNSARNTTWLKVFKTDPNENSCDFNMDPQNTAPCVEIDKDICAKDLEDVTRNIIENDLENGFQELIDNCINFPALLGVLGINLTETAIENLLKEIFKQNNLPDAFVNAVHDKLLPSLIKRGYSKNIYEYLLSSYKFYPDNFAKVFLPYIFFETNTIDIFWNFITTLSDANKNDIISSLANIKLKPTEFSKHVLSIFELYKNSTKSEVIQEFIFDNLINSNVICSNNKTYGRLLIMYMQNAKDVTTKSSTLTGLIQNHYSPYRKACEVVLNGILKESD